MDVITKSDIVRATVVRIDMQAALFECREGDEDFECEVLQTSGAVPVQLNVGDEVLVWRVEPFDQRSVILGKIGWNREETEQRANAEIPAELVLEARERFILKCGDGSITIREDGKILIKGKDLVSRAERANRIKGGSVAIN
jgi:hypothetical protein